MKIFTKEILKKLPKVEDIWELTSEEIEVKLKLFNAYGNQTWYVYAYDPDTRIGAAFVNLIGPEFAECGDVDLGEILDMPEKLFKWKLERDKFFQPMKLNEIVNKVKNGEHV